MWKKPESTFRMSQVAAPFDRWDRWWARALATVEGNSATGILAGYFTGAVRFREASARRGVIDHREAWRHKSA